MSKTLSIYSENSISNLTLEFNITESAALIQTKNMPENSVLLIEYKFGDDCEHTFEPLIWCCGQSKLQYPTNQLMLPPIPGVYRGVFVELDEDGNVIPEFDYYKFIETEVQVVRVKTNNDFSEYYSPCCN